MLGTLLFIKAIFAMTTFYSLRVFFRFHGIWGASEWDKHGPTYIMMNELVWVVVHETKN